MYIQYKYPLSKVTIIVSKCHKYLEERLVIHLAIIFLHNFEKLGCMILFAMYWQKNNELITEM